MRQERLSAAHRSWPAGRGCAKCRRADRAQVPPGPVPASRRTARVGAAGRGGDSGWKPYRSQIVAIGRHRTLTQDSEFAIAQIVEIAIRALSPAVNDTFTGVACVDWLADALLVLAEKPPLEGNWYDAANEARASGCRRFESSGWSSSPSIRSARLSATTPAVLIRQLDSIRRLSPRMSNAARRALAEEADAIRDTATALVALDRRDLDTAYTRARAASPD